MKESFSDYEEVLKNEKEPDYGFSNGKDVYGLIQQISRSTLDYSNESTNLNDKEQDNKSEPVKDQKSRKTIYNEQHSAYELVKKIKENLLKFENDEQFLSIINENYNLSLEECIDFLFKETKTIEYHNKFIEICDKNKSKLTEYYFKEFQI